MRKLLLLLPLIAVLTACQSKKEISKKQICAEWSASMHTDVEAANMLGIGERTLYRKLKEYGLK